MTPGQHDTFSIVDEHGSFSPLQIEYLLRGLNPARIAKLKGSNASYLTQEDVRAHAIRLFGFGGWDCRTLEVALVFEEQNEQSKWSCAYRVTQEVTVRDGDGRNVARYSETAVGGVMGPMPSRSDAHDFAVKNASSQAMKRCFINLGDQFGLGLYDKGSTARIVKGTIVGVDATEVDDEPSPDNALPEPVQTLDSEPVSEITQKVTEAAAQKHVEDDEQFAAALNEVRVAAVIPDSTIRLAALAGIVSRYPAPLLGRMTNVKGHDVSLKALIDRSSAGEFVPEEAKA
jgi:recombination DNA repair RAD52 pathway protein